jgi:phosphate-selective porin OprO/OprP
MKTQNKLLTSILLTAGIISSPIISYAADSKELEDLRAQVEELKQAVKVLDRKNEIVAEDAVAAKKKDAVVKASEKGFAIESADGKNTVKFNGLLQADYRFYDQGANDVRGRSNGRAGPLDAEGFRDANDSALLRRVRPTIQGTLGGKYDYRFTPDFGGGTTTVVDAYIDAKFSPFFKVRAGKFKSFVGLERLQSGADIRFVERSYVTNAILPNRDLGIAVHGDLFSEKLNYAVGIVNGVADGGNITTGTEYNDAKEWTGRLFATPFKDEVNALSGLGLGLAATYTDFRGDRNLDFAGQSVALSGGSVDATRNGLPSYVTEGQNTFFRYGSNVLADGERLRVSPQAYYYNGPLGVIGEYAWLKQDVAITSVGANTTTPTSIEPGTHKTLNHNAWNIGATYVLTGEDNSFKGVKPKNNFDFDKGTWGAWEAGLRYSEINIDDDTFKNPSGAYGTEGSTNTSAYANRTISAKSAKTWTAGINWYLDQNTKFQLNFINTSFDGGALIGGGTAAGSPANIKDRADERAILGRLQISY